MNKIIKWWKRRNFDLKQACIDEITNEFGKEAGKKFGEMYEDLCRGKSIGGFSETITFLTIIEKVKKDSGLY